MTTDLTTGEEMALEYLGQVGNDCPGEIKDEETLCAALVFIALKNRGLVQSVIGADGPVFSLTAAGHRVLDERSTSA